MPASRALRILRRTIPTTIRSIQPRRMGDLHRKRRHGLRLLAQLCQTFGYGWIVLLFYLSIGAVGGAVASARDHRVNGVVPALLLAIEAILLVLLLSVLTIRLAEVRQFSQLTNRRAVARLNPADEVKATREQVSRSQELLLTERGRSMEFRDEVLLMRDRIAQVLGVPAANQVVFDDVVPFLKERERMSLRREHRFNVTVALLIKVLSLAAGAILTKLIG